MVWRTPWARSWSADLYLCDCWCSCTSWCRWGCEHLQIMLESKPGSSCGFLHPQPMVGGSPLQVFWFIASRNCVVARQPPSTAKWRWSTTWCHPTRSAMLQGWWAISPRQPRFSMVLLAGIQRLMCFKVEIIHLRLRHNDGTSIRRRHRHDILEEWPADLFACHAFWPLFQLRIQWIWWPPGPRCLGLCPELAAWLCHQGVAGAEGKWLLRMFLFDLHSIVCGPDVELGGKSVWDSSIWRFWMHEPAALSPRGGATKAKELWWLLWSRRCKKNTHPQGPQVHRLRAGRFLGASDPKWSPHA